MLHPLLSTAAAFAVAAVTALAPGARAAGTFYVDAASPSCSPAGPGTSSNPYCTISAALAAQGASGTTIIVRPGVYREQVTIPASGIAGSPLVVHAAGPGVFVDGADDFSNPAAWTAFTGGVWLAAGVNWTPHQVFVDGARLRATTGLPDTIGVGAFVAVPGAGLYVNLGGANPGTHTVLVGHRANGFRVNAHSSVRIEGFTVVRADDKGISVLGGSSDITVYGNQVSLSASNGIGANACTNCIVRGNVVFDNADHGILLIGGTTTTTVDWNESYRNARPTARAANGIMLFGCSGNQLIGNRWHDNQDSGEQYSSGSNNNLSLYNASWHNGDHGYDHLSSSGNTHLGDVAWGNHKDGFSFEGNAPNSHVFNCIAVENGLTTNEFDLWVDLSSSAGFVSGSNVFWNSTAQAPVKWIDTTYPSVAIYQAVSGRDAHTVQADPRFVSPAAGDFHVLAGSSAIDGADATQAGWPATDLYGASRMDDAATPNTGLGGPAFGDRGIFEYVPPVQDHAPVVAGPVNVSVVATHTLSFGVTASDPDGDAIASLTADLSGLPGGTASFISSPDHKSGTLTWTPRAGDARSTPYRVTITARNGSSGSLTTSILVTADHAPVVSAPANLNAVRGTPLAFDVTASDPDGDPIVSLTADLSKLGGNAAFTTSADHRSGHLTWTPSKGGGSPKVVFTAANTLTGTATTTIHLHNNAAEPIAAGERTPPPTLALSEAFPNPARDGVALALDLPEGARVEWAVYDLQGRARQSETRDAAAGRMTLRWTPGTAPDAGVYFARVRVNGATFTRRFLLVR